MVLALSLVIALALLSLRLIVQSRTLINSDDEVKGKGFADYMEKFTLAVFLPVGVLMVISGFLFSFLGDSFISVGFALMGTALALLIQGESIKKTGEAAKSFGRRIHRIGWVFWWVSLLGVLALLTSVLFQVLK